MRHSPIAMRARRITRIDLFCGMSYTSGVTRRIDNPVPQVSANSSGSFGSPSYSVMDWVVTVGV